MKALVTCEFRFFQTPDGSIWTTSAFEYQFWKRYLTVFDSVIVIARVKQVNEADPKWSKSDGANVTFFNLPYYVGLLGLLKKLPLLFYKIFMASKLDGLFICRVPSQTANILTTFLNLQKRKYVLEVVGDPFDVFSSGVAGKWIGKVLRYKSTNTLKKQCRLAFGVSYVTQFYLQQRYPAGEKSISSHYSSIMLNDSQFENIPLKYEYPARKLIFIGSLNQLYKAPDILLAAFSKLVAFDNTFKLSILGTGSFEAILKGQAEELNISQNVDFLGEVPSEQVIPFIKKSDVFVLPSRTEGLPRAMIEAMSQRLPCIGSNAGGIPELIDDKYCVPINDINSLYSCILDLCNNIHELNMQSNINFKKSQDYSSDKLIKRRTAFYQACRDNY